MAQRKFFQHPRRNGSAFCRQFISNQQLTKPPMRVSRRMKSAVLFAPLVLFSGCVGYNTTLFMTKSNAGLDLDAKPPTAEINISRKEGVIAPSFEGGQTPPVMASFSAKSGSGGMRRFFFGVNQSFAGGDRSEEHTSELQSHSF